MDILRTVACLMTAPARPLDARPLRLLQRGGTWGGGGLCGRMGAGDTGDVAGDACLALELVRRKRRCDARFKSPRLTRPADEEDAELPCFEPFAHFSMAMEPPAIRSKIKKSISLLRFSSQ